FDSGSLINIERIGKKIGGDAEAQDQVLDLGLAGTDHMYPGTALEGGDGLKTIFRTGLVDGDHAHSPWPPFPLRTGIVPDQGIPGSRWHSIPYLSFAVTLG